ncbi:MAG: UDP-2,4-diacetamido-2,4,6-trideoxy-beta-L-altropyranose hydrolase [Aliarcobacter sp.]|nr:UDP-2,4-diacetamido-2,4,6-trideoxy-beta-L-altropyranose hydrolase [Aliarcobacter sp.]
MNILFRADSSSFIGTGHIMRDLVLVNEFKSHKIVFATQKLSGNINYKIEEDGYKIEILKDNNFEELDALIKKLNIDMIVIDHYDINYNFEKKLKESNKNLKIFVFDDTYEKHFCDILLNHNISANKRKYNNLVPNHCELRCGSKYTLLRDEFIEVKKQKNRVKKDKINKTIFIAMGGADHSNINIKILEVISLIPNLKVNIVSTFANKNLKKLVKYCKDKSWINLHINSNKIAELMAKSDFAIVTPSVTVNEVYYLNLPMIGIKTAQNQIDMYNYLKKNRYPVIDKFNKNKLKIAINKLLKKKFDGKY